MMISSRAIRSIAVLFAAIITAVNLSAASVRVYVQFQPGQKAQAQAALAQAGAATHYEFDDLNAVAVSLPQAARAGLQHNPNIVLLEDDPVRGFLAQTVPYGITMVQAPVAVAAGATGAGIKVGIVDSGVFTGHEDLQGVAITGEPDFGAADERTWYRDYLSHGTHVVGTLAAADNSLGVIGVSPGDVAIHMVKVFGDTGNWIYSSDLLAAARVAAFKGCKIISMSLGGGRKSHTEEVGLNDLYNNKHVLLVAAAGNDGTTAVSYPAGYATVLSVAALDSTKTVASFSQKNADVELAAPGVSVESTVSYIETNSVTVNSTSYTANHVENSGRGNVTAVLVYGGLGDVANSAWSGKLVLVDRGSITFNEKVQNVQSSGGVGCIIANNVAGNDLFTLGDGNSSTIPAISVSQADGAVLQTLVGSSATLLSNVQNSASGYESFDGTSMATPHVSGVAALIWSKYPGATNVQVRQALDTSAEDLGDAGRDNSYGFGLVRADAALTALAALNPNPTPSDVTPPVISAVSAVVTNPKNGAFQISWTTNEPATSDTQVNTTIYPNAVLTTTHTKSFRGSRSGTYYYFVISTDLAGNTASAGPFTLTIP